MKVVLELDEETLQEGYVRVTKVTDKGHRKGQMPLNAVVDLLQDVFRWEVSRRGIRLVSKFDAHGFLAYGQNGAKWVALKVVPPGEYYLVTDGSTYLVRLPRIVALVGNYTSPHIWWTPSASVSGRSWLFPLMIGNVASNGAACVGSTGLRCERPEEIDQFVKQLLEAPTTGHLLQEPADSLYESLARQWDPTVGAKYGITVRALLEALNRQLQNV